MKSSILRFRQVHLDFHTSPDIAGIGEKFNREQWQKTLLDAKVDSITTFALCHHGYCYYDTQVGEKHPELKFDLLREQFDACKEVGINVPIYLTAGSNWLKGVEHPEWVEISYDGKTCAPTYAGWRRMCFNTPYLDYLCDQIKEVVTIFPNCDGLFMDIISQGECCCKWCMESMRKNGLDPESSTDRKKNAQMTMEKYYRETTTAAKHQDPDMPIFHNSGHVTCGSHEILQYFSHLELESLPTGGWGYDHFPMAAKYWLGLKHDFLGMTGKFHSTWGEFGGYKHPDALRYECAAMLAFGAKCSVGDQLHPSGKLDSTTYRMIGAAYKEVEAKESWCKNIENIAEIALFSVEGTNNDACRDNPADIGASRLLFEGHFLFDIIDSNMDLAKYKLIILPDEITVDDQLRKKINLYLKNGGKMLLTGSSGLNTEKGEFLWDIGADYFGESEFNPDYILPSSEFRSDFIDSPAVMYCRSQRIKVKNGRSCGKIYDPCFNRENQQFCSHQHAPAQLDDSGYDCGVINNNIMYLAHPVFTNYRWYGASIYREFIDKVIKHFLKDELSFESNLPAQARVNLVEQPQNKRYILHLLYANKILRAGDCEAFDNNVRAPRSVEIIEGLETLHDVNISTLLHKDIKKITLEPQGEEIPFETNDGKIEFTLDSFCCHQMIVFHY